MLSGFATAWRSKNYQGNPATWGLRFWHLLLLGIIDSEFKRTTTRYCISTGLPLVQYTHDQYKWYIITACLVPMNFCIYLATSMSFLSCVISPDPCCFCSPKCEAHRMTLVQLRDALWNVWDAQPNETNKTIGRTPTRMSMEVIVTS